MGDKKYGFETDYKRTAIALKYDHMRNSGPHVSAKGRGFIADKIIEKAMENNIPIQEDRTLIELLGQLNINEKIPEELYEVVAEVFAFVYKIDQQKKKDKHTLNLE